MLNGGAVRCLLTRPRSWAINLDRGGRFWTPHSCTDFQLKEFLALFWMEPGLRRSIDKVYEMVVYALFSALMEAMEISVEVSIHPDKMDILYEFKDFAQEIIQLSPTQTSLRMKGKINRQGVTNASDRGLDMWANFGIAIQIKHLSLTKELAESVVSTLSADRIVIVCKDAEKELILSLLNQMGWKAKIQSIVTEGNLMEWYEKAMRGKHAELIGPNLMKTLQEEIETEFPVTHGNDFDDFMQGRGYPALADPLWES
ncbi:MAG: HaeII family restriction endonuclease [Magnetococcales bacterium]|nr:HaeII family restriction endonuclease [Magnetococcales bacterium]